MGPRAASMTHILQLGLQRLSESLTQGKISRRPDLSDTPGLRPTPWARGLRYCDEPDLARGPAMGGKSLNVSLILAAGSPRSPEAYRANSKRFLTGEALESEACSDWLNHRGKNKTFREKQVQK